MSSVIQNIIVAVGLIALVGLGYYLYSNNKDAILSTTGETVNSQLALESEDFLRRLNELTTLTLDGSIFTDPRFRSLMDRRPPVIQGDVGRDNPFLQTTE